MLRNVLEDYLSSIKDEREFDYPLRSLLQAMGFYDIHLTHGKTEFGKDFIAKRIDDGIVHQYSVQSKRGDIKQADFRNGIMGQLMEASLLGIVHPQFDRSLPRRVIFATTGRLRDNAGPAFQDMNLELTTNYQKNPVTFWGYERFIELSEEFGLSGIHQNTVKGMAGYGQFYLSYSKAMQGDLSDREIEKYSRFWLDEGVDYKKRILRAAIEAEIIATKLTEGGHIYEALTVYQSFARLVIQVTYDTDDPFVCEIYKETIDDKVLPMCRRFFGEFRSAWDAAEKSLIHLCLKDSAFPMVHYLVWCARVLETSALHYFLTEDQSERDEIISFVTDFIEKEEGAGHIPSDRYAVSSIWTALALKQAEKMDEAKAFVKRNVVWLCDRVEKGFGIARYEADEDEETRVLLGYPFEFIKVERNRSYLFATALADLAAFLGDKEFYVDIVNDFEACEIVYHYWQLPDTKAICTIETEECVAYSNVSHQFSLTNFEDYSYSEHMKHEPPAFQITKKVGMGSLVLLSVLLKDRYFPKAWKQIIDRSVDNENSKTLATANAHS